MHRITDIVIFATHCTPMAAHQENKYWQFRNKHGRDYAYTPEQLWEESCKYFEWVEKNPLLEARPVSYQGETKIVPVPHMRAMTFEGLCTFLDISHTTYDNYRNNNDFVAITTRIDAIIRTQKFEGAAAELLNPNIIARDLGLADKKELDHRGGPLVVNVSNDKAKEGLKDVIGGTDS